MNNIICKNSMTNEVLIVPENRVDTNLVDTYGYIFDKNNQMSEIDYEKLDQSLKNVYYDLSPDEALESFQTYMKENHHKAVEFIKCRDLSLPT